MMVKNGENRAMSRQTAITAVLGLLLVFAIGVLVVMLLDSEDESPGYTIPPIIQTEHYGDFPRLLATLDADSPLTVKAASKPQHPELLVENNSTIQNGYCVTINTGNRDFFMLLAYVEHVREGYGWYTLFSNQEEFNRFGC